MNFVLSKSNISNINSMLTKRIYSQRCFDAIKYSVSDNIFMNAGKKNSVVEWQPFIVFTFKILFLLSSFVCSIQLGEYELILTERRDFASH